MNQPNDADQGQGGDQGQDGVLQALQQAQQDIQAAIDAYNGEEQGEGENPAEAGGAFGMKKPSGGMANMLGIGG